MDEHLKESMVSSELVFDGRLLKVRKDVVRLPNGGEATREYFRHPGAVVIIPLLDDGRVLLERQYRYPNDRIFIELPAGKLEYGEDPLLCAQRELREETGYVASDWQFVCTIHNAIAYSDEHLEIFLARGLSEGEQQLDDEEFLELITVSPAELMDCIRQGQITDVKTIIGGFWLEKVLAGQWRPGDARSVP